MELIEIGNTDIILQELGDGKGKIIISDTDYDYNFSFYWGAMGKDTSLRQFIKQIDHGYFVGKLAGNTKGAFNSKKTFRNIRKFIREEFSYDLPWYKHMEFQKGMRESLNDFQRDAYDDRQFVDDWDGFWEHTVDYYSVDGDGREMDSIKSLFTGICEPWDFIETGPSRECIWLEKLHKKLKKIL